MGLWSGQGLGGGRMAAGAVGVAVVMGVAVLSLLGARTGDGPAAAPVGDVALPVMPTQSAPPSSVPASSQPLALMAPLPDVVRIDAQGGALIAGRAPAGTQVAVRLDGAEIIAVPVDTGGQFVALFDLDPSDSPRLLSLHTLGQNGAETDAKDTIMVAAISAPAMPPVTAAVAEDVVQAVQTPATTPQVMRVTETGVDVLQGAPELVTSIGLDTISYDAEGAVLLAGRGQAQSVVRVYLDNTPIKSTRIAADGDWQTDLPSIDTGLYTLRIDEIAADGQVMSRLETPFERTAPERAVAAAAQPGIFVITVQPGFTLWGIADARFGDGRRYVQLFEANRALIRNPDLIFPGQVFTLPE
jgi:hypothetical protein